MLILARKHPLKRILLVLVAVIMAGNVCAALALNFWTLMAARFVSGLPHGAYFGVGSIAAEKLADKGKDSSGLHHDSRHDDRQPARRSAGYGAQFDAFMESHFPAGGMLGNDRPLLHLAMDSAGGKSTGHGIPGQFRFLRSPAPWLLIFATMLGNGGVFCWYSFVSPMLVHVSGFSPDRLTLLMILAGFGMVVGNLTGGRLSDRFTPGRVAAVSQGSIFVILLLLFFTAHTGLARRTADVSVTAGLFAVSSPQQILLIRYSKGGEMLGAEACR